MSSFDQLIHMFDDAWFHKDESVMTVLEGVTPGEATWQHSAYAAEQPMPDMPAPGSILWQVAHLEHSARHYAEILRLRPVTNEPMTSPPKISTLSELLALMQQAHAELRGQITHLSESDLTRPCARAMTVEEFVRMVIRHDTWHAGQIAVGRRLFQESSRIRRE